MKPCPCRSQGAAAGNATGAVYAACCGRYHAGGLHLAAPTPEALMRSRYSAYVLELRQYLLDTWHERTRPETLELADAKAKWLGLSIKRAWMINDGQGFVEFVARSRPPGGGPAQRMHEVSRFVRDETTHNRWQYVEAVNTQTDPAAA